ncbi:MAG TPA: tetratricopeptide repeat protein [Candidatus Sulfotelmatobacter sp.]|nr:tetratricopeptide repeat protein [Candidatus Sulfotelmatobacter sp.]
MISVPQKPQVNGEQPAKKTSPWRVWILRIAFALVAPVLLLVLLEGGLRLFHVGYSTALMEPCTIHGQPASCYNLFFPAPYFPPGIIKAPQFFSIPAMKSQSTYRIVVLGESAAEGDPDPAYGFSRYLEIMLRSRFPGAKFEMINTGMVAINSHVIRDIAQQLAAYQPDLFIVYSGSNEVVGPYGPGTVLTSSSMNPALIRTSIFLRSTRLGQLLTTASSRRSEWRGMEMFLDKQVRADSPRLQPAYRNFAINLKDIADSAQNAGAHVLLSTVATNLRDSAPFGSLHREGLSVDARNKWDSLVRQGIALEIAGSNAEALQAYESAAKLDDQYAELHFRMARCLSALGDYAAANGHFVRARDLDTLRFRADSRINEIIRSVAASSGPHVQLLDAQSLFAENSRNGVAGNELLYDHVHLTPLGSYLFARAAYSDILKILPQRVLSLANGHTDPPSEVDCEALLALTPYDRSRVASEMIERLQRPPFTGQLSHAEQVQSLMFRAGGYAQNPQETAAQYEWAIAQAPYDLTLHAKYGLFLFNYNRNASAQQLILARPNDAFPVFLPDGTQIR